MSEDDRCTSQALLSEEITPRRCVLLAPHTWHHDGSADGRTWSDDQAICGATRFDYVCTLPAAHSHSRPVAPGRWHMDTLADRRWQEGQCTAQARPILTPFDFRDDGPIRSCTLLEGDPHAPSAEEAWTSRGMDRWHRSGAFRWHDEDSIGARADNRLRWRNGRASLTVGGLDITSEITSLSMSIVGQGLPQVRIALADVDLDIPLAKVVIGQRSAAVLLALGWRAPDPEPQS